MTLLNCDVQIYAKKIKRRKIIAAAVLAATAILSVLLAVFRTDQTHSVFLAIIIVADIACGWFLIAWYSFAIAQQSALLRLVDRDKSLMQGMIGVAGETGEGTQAVQKLQCYSVTVSCGDAERVVFIVKDGGIKLEQGVKYHITTADNIVISAEATV